MAGFLAPAYRTSGLAEHSAVDHKRCAGDGAGGIRQQERHRLGDLERLDRAADRLPVRKSVLERLPTAELGVVRYVQWRINERRADSVGADSPVSEVKRHCLGEH